MNRNQVAAAGHPDDEEGARLLVADNVADDEKLPEQANIEDAIEFRNLHCPRKLKDGHFKTYSVCGFHKAQFSHYGIGIYLYYKTVSVLGGLFVIMAMLTSPSIYLNIETSVERGITDATVMSSTAAFRNIPTNYTHDLGFLGTLSTKDASVFIAFMDALCVLIIFVLFIHLKHRLAYIEEKFHEEELNVELFSILVTSVPGDITAEEAQDFFQTNFGKVMDVSITYNNLSQLDLACERTELLRQASAARLRGRTVKQAEFLKKATLKEKEIEVLEHKIDKKSVAVFVTFEHQESVHAALHFYPRSLWFRCCYPKNKKLRGCRIKIQRAGAPSNIIYKNLKYSACKKKLRRCGTTLISVLVLLVAVAVVFGLQTLRNSFGTLDTSQCIPTTRDEALASDHQLICYCNSLSPLQLVQDTTFCSQFIKEYATTKGIFGVMAVVIVGLNLVLQIVISKIAVLQLHSTFSNEQFSIAWQLFISSFVNTALIIALVNANFDVYFPADNVITYLFNGKFSDFTAEWYSVVGFSVFITCFINTINPHWIHLGSWLVSACKRSKKVQPTETQAMINKKYSGKKFQLAAKYSQMLNVVFVTFMFSGGMPILIPMCGVTMCFIYWLEKLAFLRVYATPPRYDGSLSAFAMSVLPWALLLHLPVAFWMVTSEGAVSYDLLPELETAVSQASRSYTMQGVSGVVATSTGPDAFIHRFFMGNGFILVSLWVVLLVVQLLRNTILRFIPLCSCSCGVPKKLKRFTPYSHERTRAKFNMLSKSNHSYSVVHQEQYRDAFQPLGYLAPPPAIIPRAEPKGFVPGFFMPYGYYSLRAFKFSNTPKKRAPPRDDQENNNGKENGHGNQGMSDNGMRIHMPVERRREDMEILQLLEGGGEKTSVPSHNLQLQSQLQLKQAEEAEGKVPYAAEIALPLQAIRSPVRSPPPPYPSYPSIERFDDLDVSDVQEDFSPRNIFQPNRQVLSPMQPPMHRQPPQMQVQMQIQPPLQPAIPSLPPLPPSPPSPPMQMQGPPSFYGLPPTLPKLSKLPTESNEKEGQESKEERVIYKYSWEDGNNQNNEINENNGVKIKESPKKIYQSKQDKENQRPSGKSKSLKQILNPPILFQVSKKPLPALGMSKASVPFDSQNKRFEEVEGNWSISDTPKARKHLSEQSLDLNYTLRRTPTDSAHQQKRALAPLGNEISNDVCSLAISIPNRDQEYY